MNQLTANPGYAADQLRRAVEALAEDGPAADRAGRRVASWWSVVKGMLSGAIQVGSRTPLADAPTWATPQVLSGGFASGSLMAGGPLTDQEYQWLITLGRGDVAEPAAQAARTAVAAQAAVTAAWESPAADWRKTQSAAQAAAEATATAERAAGPARAVLHAHLLSEGGLPELLNRLADGRYRAHAPEETALLCVAWLALHGHGESARRILDAISPYFDRLRFYPVRAETVRRDTSYALHTVHEVRARWQRLRVPSGITRQRAVLGVCVPLHDRLGALWLETVAGEAPNLQRTSDTVTISGGWPCQSFPEGWISRARALADDIAGAGCERLGSRWATGRRGTFPWLVEPLANAIHDPTKLTGRQVTRIRLALAQIASSRGLPGTPRCESVRDAQRRTLHTPLLSQFAAVLSRRTLADPGDEGLSAARLAELSAPPSVDEDKAVAGLPMPLPLRKKLAMAQEGSLAELIDARVATSTESVVSVFPRLVARARSAGWSDPALQRLAAETYLAFARRRSLLLLNLESQVNRMEIPWVHAIELHRDHAAEAQAAAKSLLTETTCLVLRHFPHTILPNRFIRESRTLIRDAGLDLPLTEELATDIFMGTFTGHFLAAAHQAASLMNGSLYARYYGIPYDRVSAIKPVRTQAGVTTCPDFARLCVELAASTPSTTPGRGTPAANGTVIEQQQIITTHNLAMLFVGLDLDRHLGPELPQLAQSCFSWILKRMDRMPAGWVQRLRATKQMAYAWRQMIFFLSRTGEAVQRDFLLWAHGELAKRSERVREGFQPALRGLGAAVAGRTQSNDDDLAGKDGVRFLGWTTGRHWLLTGLKLTEAAPKAGS